MRKFVMIIFFVMLGVILTGCGTEPAKGPEKFIEQLKSDAELKDHIYHRVCFNVYEKHNTWHQPKFVHVTTHCYYINANDFGTEDPNNLEIYSQVVNGESKYKGYLIENLTKINNKYGFDIYNGNAESYKPILPVCEVSENDSSQYCISTYWVSKTDIVLNDIVILNP